MPRATSTTAPHHGQVQLGVRVAASSLRAWTGSISASHRPAAVAAASKYAHQKAQVTAMRTAAATTPASTPASAPTPMATIDSPRATIMMSPWRSAKCSATKRHPRVSMNSGPAMSRTRAVAHTARRASPSSRAPATRMATPIEVLAANPTTEWRRPGSLRLARRNNVMWPARTAP